MSVDNQAIITKEDEVKEVFTLLDKAARGELRCNLMELARMIVDYMHVDVGMMQQALLQDKAFLARAAKLHFKGGKGV